LIGRAADPADVPGIGGVSHAAGQPDADSGADNAYVELLLKTATVRVVEEPRTGAIIAWGAVRSGPLGSMLTDLFVHPDHHGRGVGGALLRALWPQHTAPQRFTFSSQHVSALPLGLQLSWPLLYLSRPSAVLPPPPMRVEQVDAAVACEVDSQLASGDRCADYAHWTRSGSGQAIVVHGGDWTVAVGVLRGGNLVHRRCCVWARRRWRPGLAAGCGPGACCVGRAVAAETERVAGSRSFMSSAPAGYRFPREVTAVAVRWYVRYGLSYRDVEELLAERGHRG